MSVINTNVQSLTAQRNLAATTGAQTTAIQRLSSGLRINSAKDDAAGLAISERMTTQIRGLNVAARNANDGISLAQTAEGALGEISSNLQRIRELTVQSSNSSNSQEDRDALQKEVDQLGAEIARVVGSSKFNGSNLLDATAGADSDGVLTFQVGANGGDTIDVDLGNADMTSLVTDFGAAGAFDISTNVAKTDFDTQLKALDTALTSVNTARADLGAVQNRFQSVVNNINITSENLSDARSRIRDADFAKETAEMTRAQILNQAGTAMLSQANSSPQSVLSLLR